ncbi:hypothetical protein AT251_23890 [Enterovibrio nigricans]|nr:hypothetical protein [Enterovibrio nigricans]PKF48752.1 hypothetical protein AT251_23890 [Enterovibrio nigricans]
MAGYYYHSSRTGHSSGSNYNAQGGYNSGYSSGSNGSNQGYSSNSGYSNQGYSSAAYSTGNGYNQASNSNYYTYGNNAAAAQTSRNQIYQQYWDVHNRFWGDNGGVQNTTQWGSYWADKTLQNPSASIWQSDGHLNLNAFTSALDNYSNHQYNYNKQGAGNYSGYNSSASIYNQTPDWNNHYGSDVLGQYYQTGYNDQTVQGLNSSWTERQTSLVFNLSTWVRRTPSI